MVSTVTRRIFQEYEEMQFFKKRWESKEQSMERGGGGAETLTRVQKLNSKDIYGRFVFDSAF